MTSLIFSEEKPALLVSVRSAAEARTALAGGADVIDVKEPDLGSLGAANTDTIADVVRTVEGRAMVTAALGELLDLADLENGSAVHALPSGVSLFKIGLARCAAVPNWQTQWKRAVDCIQTNSRELNIRPVAVVYADWRIAQSPRPLDVLQAAVELRSPALLIDTWNKSAGSLFDHWPIEDLRSVLSAARGRGLAVVLAGSLHGESILAAARLRPDLIAVRAAACEAGRGGTVSRERVRELKRTIAAARTAAITPGGRSSC
jgi:uncharacterized protein (UPF0264 family)